MADVKTDKTDKTDKTKTIVLGLSPKAAGLVRTALVIECAERRGEDATDASLGVLSEVIAEIDRQKGGV